MNFWELRGTIQKSDSSEWRRVDSGVTYRDRFVPCYGGGRNYRLEHDSHSDLAVYIPDVDLTIAYGMDEELSPIDDSGHIDKTLEWSEVFPDRHRKVLIADIFWRGSLVDRVDYIAVDGYRAYLPIGGGHDGLDIDDFQHDVARLIDGIAGHDEFKTYYGRIPSRTKF
jgi:hypothetical protein